MEAILTVGISACGKSTYAGLLKHTEINRDDIRFGIVMPEAQGSWKKYVFSKENEALTTSVEDGLFKQAVEDGNDIVISNTNIITQIRRDWIKRCKKEGYTVKIVVFNISLEEAIQRDSFRGKRSVGEKVITSQYEKLQKVYEMATRPQGIGGSEERALYKETYGFKKDDESGEIHVNITDSQKNYIRTQVRNKATQEGKVALFVPDWVALSAPHPSFNRMLEMTNDLYERMQEYLSEYMVEFNMPKESRYAIEQQLLIMLVPKYSPRNIYDVCKQAAEVVDQLEYNLDQSPDKHPRVLPSKVRTNYSKDLEDSCY